MTNADSYLDVTRLEKVRRTGSKIIARCPACHALGNDRSGEHLAILPSGKFACAALPGDAAHRREIFKLVGVVGKRKPDPERDRRWRMERDEAKFRELARTKLIATAKAKRDRIIARWEWDSGALWENSPQRIDQPLTELDPYHFLQSLFPQDAVLWTGEVHESGQDGIHASRWKTVAEWQAAERVAPMTTPAIWKPGTTSRAAENVMASPYVVLDFDGLDGRKPKTPEEIQAHLRTSLAMIRWIREGLHWELAAILFTGSVSFHAWFVSPPQDVLQSLKDTAAALGMDAGLIGHPEHPCRLPGQRHAKTGGVSRVLWLQLPIP